MSGRDRRNDSVPTPRYPRLRALRETVVLLKAGDQFGVGSITNISLAGAFIATPMVLRPGSDVVLSVEIAGVDRTFALKAEVIWHNHRFYPVVRELPPGYGVRFIASSESGTREAEHLFREVSWGDLDVGT